MSTEDRIRSFILEQLNFKGTPGELSDDYDLIERGVLDSLGVFQMTSFLEREFRIEVRDDELVPEHYGTIGRLARLVDSKGSSG